MRHSRLFDTSTPLGVSEMKISCSIMAYSNPSAFVPTQTQRMNISSFANAPGANG
jgi:hypothetical protein